MKRSDLTPGDLAVVESFENFLSWGQRPNMPGEPARHLVYRPVPPAWFAYAWALTNYCPPKGTM